MASIFPQSFHSGHRFLLASPVACWSFGSLSLLVLPAAADLMLGKVARMPAAGKQVFRRWFCLCRFLSYHDPKCSMASQTSASACSSRA